MKVAVVGGSSGLGFRVSELLTLDHHQVDTYSRRGTGPEKCYNLRYDIDTGFLHPQIVGRDVVVISAGKGAFYGPHQVTSENLDSMIATNLRGPLLLANQLITMWRLKHREGRIVFITSTAGNGPAHGLGIYAACKKGVEGFVRAEANHCAKYGIGLVALSLGWFESPMTAALKPEIRAAAERHCPQGRFATLDEAATWVCQHVKEAYAGVFQFWVQ